MGQTEQGSQFPQEPLSPTSGESNRSHKYPVPRDIPLGLRFIGDQLSALRREKPTKKKPEAMASPQEKIITEPTIEGEVLGPIDKVNDFPPKTDTLEESLNEGPSKLIVAGLKKDLERIAQGDKATVEAPLVAWMLNLKAGIQVVKSLTDRALAIAKVKKSVADAAVWLAEAAEKDVRSAALGSRMVSLEKRYGGNQELLEDFCRRHNINIQSMPERNTLKRQEMLLAIEGEQVALQRGADRWAKRAGDLMEREVDIQLDTDENNMLAKKMPEKIRSKNEANVRKEEELTEDARHATASASGVVVGGATGLAIGPLKAFKNAIQVEVKAYPELAVSFLFFAGGTSVLVVLSSSVLTLEKIGIALAGGGVLGLTSAIGTAAILGIKQHQEMKRRQSEIQQA